MGNDEPTDDPLIEWLRDTVGPGPFVPQSIYGAVLATLSALDAARFRLEAVTTDWKFEVRRAQSWRLAADTWQQRAEAAEAETLRLRAAVSELISEPFHSYDTRDMGRAYHADGVDDLLDAIRVVLGGTE